MKDPELTEPQPAPEIFVDGYQSTMVANGVVKFTFFSITHDPASDTHERRIVLRLSTSMPSVAGIHEALGQFLKQVAAQEGNPRAH